MAENTFAPQTEAHAGPQLSLSCGIRPMSEGCAAKEPQDLCLSWRGVARDRRGNLQLNRQEDAGTAGRPKRSTSPTNLAGQHRQQCPGPEEPTSGPTPEGAAASGACCCNGRRSSPCVCNFSATDGGSSVWADRCCRTLPSWSALPAAAWLWSTRHGGKTTQSRTAAGPADCRQGAARADDARFASNLAYSRSFDQPQGPGQMAPVRNNRQTAAWFPHGPQENSRPQQTVTNGQWRRMLIQPLGSPTSFMRGLCSTQSS